MRARAFLLLSLIAFAAGCPASAQDVQPPADQFYFPTGLAASPDGRYLFVTNANSDLRYGSSSLQVIDLDVVDSLVRTWLDDGTVPAGCSQDLDRRQSVICPEEDEPGNAGFLLADSTVRIGNFVGEVRVQELTDGRARLFMPVRGDPSITWVDFDGAGPELSCGGTGAYPRCDGDHQLVQIRNDPELYPLGEEPFGIYVDGANGYVVVTHLTTGNVSLATAPPDGLEPPLLVDVKGGFFQPDRTTGARGAVGVAGREPGKPDDRVYVTSRTEARVQTLYVAKPEGDKTYPLLVPSDYFFLNTVFPATDTRGLVFSADGNRAYFINRRPPSLIAVDTSLDEQGSPRNDVLQATELCREAGLVTLLDSGRGDRAYVSCFRDGQVWVIDPDTAVLDAVIDVGRGPHALVASPSRKQLYVTNFLENTVAVIDTTPGSPTEHRVVVRLGEPDFGEGN